MSPFGSAFSFIAILKFAQNIAKLLPAIGGPERTAIPAKKAASPRNLCILELPDRSTCRDKNPVLAILRVKFYGDYGYKGTNAMNS